jgi:predicted ribonuclease toxin of YeeF-YezG toxin-antitoxin module
VQGLAEKHPLHGLEFGLEQERRKGSRFKGIDIEGQAFTKGNKVGSRGTNTRDRREPIEDIKEQSTKKIVTREDRHERVDQGEATDQSQRRNVQKATKRQLEPQAGPAVASSRQPTVSERVDRRGGLDEV